MECNVSDYANNKPKRNPSILHGHKQQNKFSCMHVKQQFIPFIFQTGLEGKQIQENDSQICKVSPLSMSAKVPTQCSSRYFGGVAMSLVLLVFIAFHYLSSIKNMLNTLINPNWDMIPAQM